MLLHEKCTSLGGKKRAYQSYKNFKLDLKEQKRQIGGMARAKETNGRNTCTHATFNGHYFGSGIWCAEQIHASHDNHANQPIHQKSS